MVITRNIFDLTLPVTQLLQAKTNYVMDGIDFIQALKNLGVTIRNQIEFYHDQWYQQAISLAAKIDVQESMPRTISRQTTRDNPLPLMPLNTLSELLQYL